MASHYIVINAALAEIADLLQVLPISVQTKEWASTAAKYQVVLDSWESSPPTREQIKAMEVSVTGLRSEVVASEAPTINIIAPPSGYR